MPLEEERPSIGRSGAIGLLALWLLTILLLQFTIWVTISVLDFDASWRQCGLVSALWVFTSIWFSALKAQKN